jgi:predicted alpha/beta hydrolase family esterase
MAKQVLFVQGASAGAYEADAKLAESLRNELGPNYQVRYPAMPGEDEPDYDTWRRLILREAEDMGGGAILAGHSIGASVLIKMLTDGGQKPSSIAGVFLASSPFWHEHEFWRWDEVALSADAGARYPRGVPLFLYHGDDDTVPVAHVEMLAKLLPQAVVRRLPGRDHQLNGDMSEMARDIEGLS